MQHLKKTIYLSGKLTGRSKKQVILERKKAIRLLRKYRFHVVDPVSIESSSTKTFAKKCSLQRMASYVLQEKEMIDCCDAILVLTGDEISDGSWMEMSYGLYKRNIPVILIGKKRFKKEIVGWSNIETYVVPSLNSAIKKLNTIFKELEEIKELENPKSLWTRFWEYTSR